MNATNRAWTINDIQTAMRQNGSHWFDPDTMRFFKSRVLSTVYQGSGGIYFVTSECGPSGHRAYSVRKFTPETFDISTVGEFNEMTKARAVGLAKRSAWPNGANGIATDEPYRPISVLEQFRADCQKHGNPKATWEACRRMVSLSKRYDLFMVQLCNGEIEYDAAGELPYKVRRKADNIKATAKDLGAKGVILGGDPRGCVVKLVWHDGETNDFGKEGWCVPYSS